MYTLRLMPRTAWYWLTEGYPLRALRALFNLG
jgi:hypothetical protein